MISIVDYGMGNLGSIANMLKYIGCRVRLAQTPDHIRSANRLILPGVGAFDTAMEHIRERNLREALDDAALVRKIPILGICLGMQIMTEGSEEGQMPGLGWVPARVHRFPHDRGHRVPHMGWNIIRAAGGESPIGAGLHDDARFYFVHSYYVKVRDPADSMFVTNYIVDFDSGIGRGNIQGVQFHPEKSHKFGMKLLINFSRL